MSDNQDDTVIFDLADSFIELANRLMSEEKHALAHVSTALRYAAARFSTHEAACTFEQIATEKNRLQEWYTKQFSDMLDENFEDHIERLGQNLIVELSAD